MIRGAASTTIRCTPDVVFAAISDVDLMGTWSPECVGARWVPPATGPAVGAQFEGDNVAKLGPITLKKWTTTSEVTASKPGELFEFTAAGYTHWRYELIGIDGATLVTESFTHDDYTGFKKFLYGTLLKRTDAMVRGMDATLGALKQVLEANKLLP